MGKGLLLFFVLVSTVANLINIYLNVIQLSVPTLIGTGVIVVLCGIFAFARMKYVHMDPSFEEIEG